MRPGMAKQPEASIVSNSTPARASAPPSAPIASITPAASSSDVRPRGAGANTSAFSMNSIGHGGETRAAKLVHQRQPFLCLVDDEDDQIARPRFVESQAQRVAFLMAFDDLLFAHAGVPERGVDDRRRLARLAAAQVFVFANDHAIERGGDRAR